MTGSLLTTHVSETGTWACPAGKLVLAAGKARTDEWYELRRTGIGASDLASIYGESPYADSTPYGVWLDKLEARHLDETPAMHWGTVLEDAVVRDWALGRGLTVRNVGTYRSRTHEHCLANPDRLTSDGGGVEVKTANAFTKDWRDGAVPTHHRHQSEFCMAVTGRCHWWLICLLGGQRMEVRLLRRTDCLCPVDCAVISEVTPATLAAHLDFAEAWWARHIDAFEAPAAGRPVEQAPIEPGSVAESVLPEATLDDRARALAIKADIAGLGEELGVIMARLTDEIGDKKLLRADGIDVARMIERRGARRFNRKRFGTEHPDLDGEYTEVGPPTRYLSLIGGNDE